MKTRPSSCLRGWPCARHAAARPEPPPSHSNVIPETLSVPIGRTPAWSPRPAVAAVRRDLRQPDIRARLDSEGFRVRVRTWPGSKHSPSDMTPEALSMQPGYENGSEVRRPRGGKSARAASCQREVIASPLLSLAPCRWKGLSSSHFISMSDPGS